MKELILVLTLFSAVLHSQNDVRLFSAHGAIFNVIVKDSVVNKNPEASVLIKNIMDDTLTLTVKFDSLPIQKLTFFLLDKRKKSINKEFNYKLVSNNKIIKAEFVDIYDIKKLPDPIVPKKPVVDTSQKYKNILLGHLCELKDGKPFYFNNIPKNGKCQEPMPDSYLGHVRILMTKTQVPDDKYEIVKNVTVNNCMTVKQLNDLLIYIDYELDKLKLIRTAYFNLTDTLNRKDLSKSFRFESSNEELKNFFRHTGDFKTRTAANCIQAAKEEEIIKIINILEGYTNDNQRLEYLKKTYSENCYSLEQVKRFLGKFIHDREKLDAAKLLYLNCIDKENFKSIIEEFSYGQYASELKEFLEKQSR